MILNGSGEPADLGRLVSMAVASTYQSVAEWYQIAADCEESTIDITMA
jgi:hypothetical protein